MLQLLYIKNKYEHKFKITIRKININSWMTMFHIRLVL